MSNLQTYYHFKLDFQKVDQHTNVTHEYCTFVMSHVPEDTVTKMCYSAAIDYQAMYLFVVNT